MKKVALLLAGLCLLVIWVGLESGTEGKVGGEGGLSKQAGNDSARTQGPLQEERKREGEREREEASTPGSQPSSAHSKTPSPQAEAVVKSISVMEQVREASFWLTEQAGRWGRGAGLTGANPGQRFVAHFDEEGVFVKPVAEDVAAEWEWALEFQGPPVKPDSDVRTKVTYQREAGVEEWFHSRAEGIEHGFTVAAQVGGEDVLRMPLRVRTGLSPELSEDRRSLHFREESGEVALRYENLIAYDARGRHLATRMELGAKSSTRAGFPAEYAIALCVETAGAVFPVTIDPLITRSNGVLAPPSPITNGRAGETVALNGNLAAVAAPADNSGPGKGAVHLYERGLAGWVFTRTISSPANDVYFGANLALSGDTLLISSFVNTVPPTPRVSRRQRNSGGAGQWGEVASWTGDVATSFAEAMAMEDDVAVVFSAAEKALYFYERNQGGTNAWGRSAKVTDPTVDGYINKLAMGGRDRLAVARESGNGTTYVQIKERNAGGPGAWGIVKTLATPAGAVGFGLSLALENDLLVVGAPGRTVGGNTFAGTAYVYREDQGGSDQWGLVATLSAPTPVPSGYYASAVAIDGHTIAVGARITSQASGLPGCFLYERVPGGVPLIQYHRVLTDSGDAISSNFFPQNVAVSGETVLLGNPSHNGTGGIQNSGRALIIERLTGLWTRVASPGAAELAAGMEFGAAMAMEGDLLVVGAPGYNNLAQGGAQAGAVFIFTRSNDLWTLQRKIEGGSLTQAGDRFGASVALCGELLAVGAPGQDNTRLSVQRPGEVYLFRQHGDDSYDWDQVRRVAPVAPGSAANYGKSLSLDATWLAVGYPHVGGGGKVYMHLRNRNGADTWGLSGILENPADASEASEDFFGDSVALSGSFLVVGAPRAEGRKMVGLQLQTVVRAGRAYVFEVQDTVTNQWGLKVKLPITQLSNTPFGETDGYFGQSVAFQGTQLAVGAPGENNGDGRVHVHERAEGASTVTWGRVAVVDAGNLPVQGLGADVALQDGLLAAAGVWKEAVGLNSPVALLFERNLGGADQFGFEGLAASSEVRALDTPERGNRYVGRVALWGRQLALSSPLARTAGAGSGHADVFYRQDQRWAFSRTAPDPTNSNSNQVNSLDIQADRAAVGYYFTADDPSVYLLERNQGGADQWGVVKKISESAGSPNAISLSGRFLAVGSPSSSSSGLSLNGSVFLYEQNSPGRNGWGFILRIPGGQNQERFGSDVSLEGDRLLIGASGYDLSAGQTATGAAYIYERDQTAAPQWQFVRRFHSSSPQTGEQFGISVALDHDVAAIGANRYNGNRGRVYLHRRNQGGSALWGQAEAVENPVTNGVYWGYNNLAMDGGWLLAGSVRDGSSTPWGVGVLNAASLLDPDPPPFQISPRLLEFPAGTVEAGAVQDISGGTVVASNSNWEDGSGSRFFVFGRNVGGSGAWGMEAAIDHPGHNAVAISHRTIIAGGNDDIRIYQLAGSDYDAWRRQVFTDNSVNNPALEATVWGDGADPDKDGVVNLVEAFAGLNPLVSEGSGAVMREAGRDAGSGEFFFRWRQGANEYGVRATPQWSTNLVDWNGNGSGGIYATVRASGDLEGGTEWEARVSLPPSTVRIFWRLFVWRE